ncbi:Hypothetical predicted protein [Podarcis lilfordi]|uniref:Uncharacterized protein n=1 Tax=Podarcis lilfordi TaxID=74358 RepID=A0AA35L3L0_9SAUR|nr:Hypothetical predicted protein [Podarcis lilfordi]
MLKVYVLKASRCQGCFCNDHPKQLRGFAGTSNKKKAILTENVQRHRTFPVPYSSVPAKRKKKANTQMDL